jgi:hypothetical protein
MALISWAGLTTAFAESRMALVIGNSAYQTVPALPNPVNDAKAVTAFLNSAGFEVTTVQDLAQKDMRQIIGQFADALAGKGRDVVALVYYGGHGLQIDGENYLVPIDAAIVREADVPLQAVRLADLMNALAAVPSRSRIVMLDACRNNPFSEINKVTGKGLAIVDAPPGTIVSYATSPGSEALDGDGEHSPYTTAFLAHSKEPGLPIEQAFKRMRFAVNDATGRQQLPWESSSLTSDFSFFPGATTFALQSVPTDTAVTKVAVTSTAVGALGNARGPGRSVDAWKRELQRRSPSEAYELVIREDSVEAYQAFLSMFPTQPNSPRVRQVLDRRRVMIAWYTAVTFDTPASYQAFLAAYPDTDLTATARRLLERAQNRSILASTGNTCPCALQPQLQQQQQPTPPKQPEQKATRSVNKKQAKKEKEKHMKRTKRAPEAEDSPPPAPVQQAAPAVPIIPMGIGIGFGGGFGGGRSMGPSHGGGHRGPSGGHTGGGGRPATGGSYSTGVGVSW